MNLTDKQRQMIRLAYGSSNRDLKQRALRTILASQSKGDRLPQPPFEELQKARQEGRLAEEDEDETEGEDAAPKKASALTAEDRKIVRLAHSSSDPRVKQALLRLLSV